MEPFRYHVFVCTQEKPENVACCSAKGSARVLEALHRELAARGLSNEVQVSTSGCLGACDNSPVMIAYPDGAWYCGLTPQDVPEIVASHFAGGKVVPRLARKDIEGLKSEILEHRDHYLAMLKAKDAAGILPDDLNETVRGFWASRALLTAFELDLFTAVGDGASAQQVAQAVGADPRATEMLLNAMAALKLLQKADGKFRNTPLSARFLTEGSPDNARPGLMHIANLWPRWSQLTDCVRSGRPAEGRRGGPQTAAFIAAMERNSRERSALVVKSVNADGVKRLLDLGGGSGAYSIAFAKANPRLQAVVLDLPEVVPLTQQYVRRAGLADRIQVRPGDMLSADLGSGYDLIVVSAICHMFSPEENRRLLQGTHAALAAGGRLVIQDFILEPDKASPRFAALFALNMLVGTQGGGTYSEPEYEEWLRQAGFREVRRVRLPGPSGLMIATP